MRSSSARRVFDYARTGTFTVINRVKSANARTIAKVAAGTGVAALAGVGLWVRSCLNEHQRISSMVDPAVSCDRYLPAHILDNVSVTDNRRQPLGFTVEDVENILASVDFRFTDGISAVRIVGDLRSPNKRGISVNARYFDEDQSIEVSNNAASIFYFELVGSIYHEVGHHVRWKLIAKGHDPDRIFGSSERFAQIFAYYLMSPASTDWSLYNPYKLEPPKPEELEWLKDNVTCGWNPEKWYLRDVHSLSVFAKLFIETGKTDQLTEVLLKLSEQPAPELATPDIKNYLALIRNEFFQIDPLHLIGDLYKIKGALDELQITPDLLLRIAEYFRGFGNTEFAEALTAFTATLR